MATQQWVDLRKIPSTPKLQVSDVEVEYLYSGDDHLKPPPMNRLSNPEAAAMHFESTRVTRIAAHNFKIINTANTAAGPFYVNEIFACVVRVVQEDDAVSMLAATTSSRVNIEVDVTGAFVRFIDHFEESVKKRSIYVNDKGQMVYQLCAAASPFFYPLNKTNVKYLNQSSGKNHTNWLHQRLLDYWTEFATTIEDLKIADKIRNGTAMPMTLHSHKGVEHEMTIVPDSILWKMISVLASATSAGGHALTYPSSENIKPYQSAAGRSIIT